MQDIQLERPLAAVDLETTGLDPKVDRIVEISVQKLFPNGEVEHRTHRINPGIPIPAEAAAVHGISDEDVAGEPRFEQVALGLLRFIDGCDILGFNVKRFDLPLLTNEFKRAGLELSLQGRTVIDAMEIFHKREPRDLGAAVQHYLGREHQGAHGAEADVRAIVDVFGAMVRRYDDLPRSVAGLQNYLKPPNSVDADGRFVRVQDEIQFAFGKCRGQPLDAVAMRDPAYLNWILGQDFIRQDAKELVREALDKARTAIVASGSCLW